MWPKPPNQFRPGFVELNIEFKICLYFSESVQTKLYGRLAAATCQSVVGLANAMVIRANVLKI